jgi:hypothetical protein
MSNPALIGGPIWPVMRGRTGWRFFTDGVCAVRGVTGSLLPQPGRLRAG